MPLVEIAVILRVGAIIGTGWTVTLLVADSVLGAWLLRRQGTRAWRELRVSLQEGRWPGDAVAQGAMILVGGTLLVTPGFVTDVVGFVLMVPPGRRVVLSLLRTRALGFLLGPRADARGRATGGRRTAAHDGGTWTSGGEVLDVEVVEIRREVVRDEPDGDPLTGGRPRPEGS